MKRKRNFKTTFLRLLRRVGWLCKKPIPPTRHIRVASTVWPDSRITPIQAEQHNWVEAKKSYRKDCHFDSATFTCKCGVKSVEEFMQFMHGCNQSKNK